MALSPQRRSDAKSALAKALSLSVAGHLLVGILVYAVGHLLSQSLSTQASNVSRTTFEARLVPPKPISPPQLETGASKATENVATLSASVQAVAQSAKPVAETTGSAEARAERGVTNRQIDVAYHPSNALSEPPQPVGLIEPDYPANDNFQEGTVVLRVLINDRGTVDNVAVVRSFPAGIFESSALAAFRKATFTPGRLFGVAVNSQMLIEVKFTPINRGGMVNGRLN